LRFFAGQDRVINRIFCLVAATEAQCQKFRDLVRAAVIQFPESVSDSAMMRPALALELAGARHAGIARVGREPN
jgi:hypothetical protein